MTYEQYRRDHQAYSARHSGKTYAAQQAQWDQMELIEFLAPLKALEHTIMQHAMLRPSAVMLPLGLGARHGDTLMGNTVILGDRTALLYEPAGFR